MRPVLHLLFLLLCPAMLHARILRVNNNAVLATTCITCYPSLQNALSAAQDGDTIHMEGSSAAYGSGTVTVPNLVIIGPGYKLSGAGSNPDLQANTWPATIAGTLTFGAGSQGGTVMGIRFAGTNAALDITSTSNITVRRNFFEITEITLAGTTTNVLIAENYAYRITQNVNAQTINNLTVRNNVFTNTLSLNDSGDQMAGLVVVHNTFTHAGTQAVRDAEVAYNVFVQGTIAGSNNTVHDNLVTQVIPGFPDNLVVPMANVGIPVVGASDDAQWDIPAHPVYAPGGADAYGIFSGISPYRLSGIPGTPTIYALSSTVNALPGGQVQVTLSTRANP
ncbi:MAG TPA: hypothetical protein PKE21_10725 [Flavobacteriales bacterium]|nr:hypothetical protein [Flavobacteriales bacterium]HMR27941.1 hypothetical protein [Flavobacteriales bacterium]